TGVRDPREPAPAGSGHVVLLSGDATWWPAAGVGRVYAPRRSGVVFDFAVQVVLVAAHDADVGEFTRHQAGLAAVLHLHQSVDFRRVGHRAGDGEFAVDGIDDDFLHAADLGRQPRFGNRRLPLHEARKALLLDVLVHRIGQIVRLRALHRRIGERADAVQLRFVEEVEEFLEFLLGLAGEADDE